MVDSLVDLEASEDTIVAWEENDPENPYNWPVRKKGFLLVMTTSIITNSSMGSSLPSNSIPFMAREWGYHLDQQKVPASSLSILIGNEALPHYLRCTADGQ